MKRRLLRIILLFISLQQGLVFAQSKTASVKVNSSIRHQKITGFGGFVNSPQFGYNHMTEAEIRQLWGKDSEAGYNIMRIYIPIGESNWSQSVNTAKLAKSLGLTVFASPWSMPTEWKTYNIIGSKYNDNGVTREVYLKEEHYGDYANYLNNYVTYLRNNGVELDAISLQNEPDYGVDYAGCIWTPAQLAKFIREYGHLINCKIIAPETVGMTDSYANAFLDPAVLANFEIYGGHQYGAIQSAFKNLQAQGKEAWMTEFLINWNADESTTRDFNWSKDAFSFANKLNDALLANVNAWIHYAAKRYYGMMGDGTMGTANGAITKRGRILSHYAKYVTGATRVENTWNDNSGKLGGSSYLSASGDSVFIVVINPSADSYSLAVDLPFYSQTGKGISTTETSDMSEFTIGTGQETVRPKVSVSPSSVTTFVFTKSRDREISQMTGVVQYYDKIEQQIVTNPSFGTNYQMSGKTFVLKNDSPLIGTNTNNSQGYLKLNDRYNRLVFKVRSLSSAYNYESANTTLYYINAAGAVSSYNYGTVVFSKRADFDWVIDISSNTLTDGCTGIIGLRNGNYTSILTFNFADVYFAFGNERGFKFSGIYSSGDSNLMDCLDDASYTSLDFREATSIASDADWHASALNKNAVFYVQPGVLNGKTNVVSGSATDKLELNDSGDFYAPADFTAVNASYQTTLGGHRMLVLPFQANIPAGVKAYQLQLSGTEVTGVQIMDGKIPANTPVLVTGSGSFVFEGSGSVSSPRSLKAGITSGIYVRTTAPLGSYYLKTDGSTPVFQKVTTASQPTINAFGGYLSPAASVSATSLSLKLEDGVLPVRLVSFSAKSEGNTVRLNWSTLSEKDNSGFEIERSAGGDVFENIGFVMGKGNSATEQQYVFNDRTPLNDRSYYRLKQIDADGTFSYSEIRMVNGLSQTALQLYPVPAEAVLNIKSVEKGTLSVFNATGALVLRQELGKTDTVAIDVSRLPSGVYFYRINAERGSFVKK